MGCLQWNIIDNCALRAHCLRTLYGLKLPCDDQIPSIGILVIIYRRRRLFLRSFGGEALG
jgi:hypothetical protein